MTIAAPGYRRLVLGSRSPRRHELLQQLFPGDSVEIEVLPPRRADEPGFDGLERRDEIEGRLRHIARMKLDDVLDQLRGRLPAAEDRAAWRVVVADTIIAVPRQDSAGRFLVLGQPSEVHWQDVVRGWFREYLFGRTHTAATALIVAAADGSFDAGVVVRTEVTFCEADEELLEWYIGTGEPRGKAGGYGIQGAGGVFVREVRGSISNVVGMPQRELLELLNASERRPTGE
jgi:septum formation protein